MFPLPGSLILRDGKRRSHCSSGEILRMSCRRDNSGTHQPQESSIANCITAHLDGFGACPTTTRVGPRHALGSNLNANGNTVLAGKHDRCFDLGNISYKDGMLKTQSFHSRQERCYRSSTALVGCKITMGRHSSRFFHQLHNCTSVDVSSNVRV